MVERDISRRRKLQAVLAIVRFRLRYTLGIVLFSVFAALLEGIGISLIVPIVEMAQSQSTASNVSGVTAVFVRVYHLVGLPFTLEYVFGGVAFVIVVRYIATFLSTWFRERLRASYVRSLQMRGFSETLDAEIAYFDREGSDEILNAIITQTKYAGRAIRNLIRFFQEALLSLVYFGVLLLLVPKLTILSVAFLGGLMLLVRKGFESGYEVGDTLAEANEQIQESAQAGTQGVRDIKLFNMRDEIFDTFQTAVRKFERNRIRHSRNKYAITNLQNTITSVAVFGFAYVALRFFALSVGTLGVFLFAMFRLGPKASVLSKLVYEVEGDLPHFVRTEQFIDELQTHEEANTGTRSVPEVVEHVAFEKVSFSYDDEEPVLQDFSFQVESGEFVAFVGQSGAGKSTVVSLLSRLYEPDGGEITANGTSIETFDLQEWRSKIAVVRQDPFIFNETLRFNLKIGNRDATMDELREVCEIAQVTEFLDDLPNGYETVLGDDGVQLSGGQRQRVAIARALLKDADLLLLDEATSDLDTAIERNVQRAIESMNREYALVTIAHRLSTVKRADRIYAVEDGEIVEAGTHEELIAKGGTYTELYSVQSKTA